MVEQVYQITAGNDRVIESVIQDENVHYNHMILNKNERKKLT